MKPCKRNMLVTARAIRTRVAFILLCAYTVVTQTSTLHLLIHETHGHRNMPSIRSAEDPGHGSIHHETCYYSHKTDGTAQETCWLCHTHAVTDHWLDDIAAYSVLQGIRCHGGETATLLAFTFHALLPSRAPPLT